MAYLIVVPAAYLLGSVPWGLIVVRLLRGVDVRKFGSGNIGATNVLRTAGAPAAVLVLALDGGKGVLAVLLARLLTDSPTAETVAGVLAVVGHNWPVFLGFKGGRGMATGTGAMAMMAPLVVAAGVAAFLPVVALTRYVSLGTLSAVAVAVVSLGIWMGIGYYPVPYFVYVLTAGAVVVLRHRDNIRRLLKGTEHRLGRSAHKQVSDRTSV